MCCCSQSEAPVKASEATPFFLNTLTSFSPVEWDVGRSHNSSSYSYTTEHLGRDRMRSARSAARAPAQQVPRDPPVQGRHHGGAGAPQSLERHAQTARGS